MDNIDDINVLFGSDALSNDRITAATNIIANYDLLFNAADLIKAANNFRYGSNGGRPLMPLLLTTNLRMFYAVIHALIDNKIQIYGWCSYLCFWSTPFDCILGCAFSTSNTSAIYCALYDYYEFDITNLVLFGETRNSIQKHIDSKVTYTKGAVKQPSHRKVIKNEK